MAVAHRRQILLHPVNDVLAISAPLTVEREVAQRRFVRRLSELLKEVVVDVAGVPADIVHATGPPPPMTALTRWNNRIGISSPGPVDKSVEKEAPPSVTI